MLKGFGVTHGLYVCPRRTLACYRHQLHRFLHPNAVVSVGDAEGHFALEADDSGWKKQRNRNPACVFYQSQSHVSDLSTFGVFVVPMRPIRESPHPLSPIAHTRVPAQSRPSLQPRASPALGALPGASASSLPLPPLPPSIPAADSPIPPTFPPSRAGRGEPARSAQTIPWDPRETPPRRPPSTVPAAPAHLRKHKSAQSNIGGIFPSSFAMRAFDVVGFGGGFGSERVGVEDFTVGWGVSNGHGIPPARGRGAFV
ncbi:hypothetical protein R3P38DRAFT_3230819 [Favolaschia claudopus]|uniref:Uncharacterized protein n=1 Tax=Favolaschia claudopus TaxID=2862362 RepID=A0AAV9ZLR2_9AGAR